MIKHQVWESVNRKSDMKIILTKWVVRIKDNGKRQACIVAVGCVRKTEKDEDVFAPVVNLTLVRNCLEAAVRKNMHIMQLDVKNAFLYGSIHDEVFIDLST